MPETWHIDAPKILDIGAADEQVTSCKVAVVGGRVDVVTHDDSPTARLEVHEVHGRPVEVSWNGSTLRVDHGKDKPEQMWGQLLDLVRGDSSLLVRLSVSLPSSALVSVHSVSADVMVSGFRSPVRAGTVSGVITLHEVTGEVKVNSVSGAIEGHALGGRLNGNTVSGGVTVQDSALHEVRLNTVSGDVVLDLSDGRAQVLTNSVSGDVTVRVPGGGGYDVTAHTASGDVVIDGSSFRGEHGQRSGSLRDGDGALRVRCTSVSGNLVMLRSRTGGPGAGGPGGVQDQPAPGPQDTPAGPGPASGGAA